MLETRYDFFYKNGVPKWRGTGYYYARFRPGVAVSLDDTYQFLALIRLLQFVGIFLTVLTSLVQYIIQKFHFRRDTERVETIIKKAKLAAWGQTMVPVNGKRKVC